MANRTQNLLHRWLPYVAAGAAVAFLLNLTMLNPYVKSLQRQDEEAARAETALTRTAQGPEASPDVLPALVVADARAVLDRAAQAVTSLDGNPRVVEGVARIVADNDTVQRLWVVNDRGSIVYFGKEQPPQVTIEKLAPEEIHRLLQGLPEGLLQPEQRLAILIQAAVQVPDQPAIHGEVRRIPGGWLAVAAQDPEVLLDKERRRHHQIVYSEKTNQVWRATGIAMVLSFLVYWFSLPGWVALDAHRRQERAAVWGLFALVGNLIGLLVYLLARKED